MPLIFLLRKFFNLIMPSFSVTSLGRSLLPLPPCLPFLTLPHRCVTSIKQSGYHPSPRVNKMIRKVFGTQWPELSKHSSLGKPSAPQSWAGAERNSYRQIPQLTLGEMKCLLSGGLDYREPKMLCMPLARGLNFVFHSQPYPWLLALEFSTTTPRLPLGAPFRVFWPSWGSSDFPQTGNPSASQEKEIKMKCIFQTIPRFQQTFQVFNRKF